MAFEDEKGILIRKGQSSEVGNPTEFREIETRMAGGWFENGQCRRKIEIKKKKK